MTMMNGEKPSLDSLTELTHHGVKGMRWGVKGVHAAKINKATARLDRVANGTATRREKLSVASRTPISQLAWHGLKNQAALDSKTLKEHLARVESGNMKIRDGLLVYGSLGVGDLIKATRRRKP